MGSVKRSNEDLPLENDSQIVEGASSNVENIPQPVHKKSATGIFLE